MRSAVAREILLRQRFADADALRMQEGVGHAAADHQRVDLADRGFPSRSILVETFAPPMIAITGLVGASSALPSASSSACMVRPA